MCTWVGPCLCWSTFQVLQTLGVFSPLCTCCSLIFCFSWKPSPEIPPAVSCSFFLHSCSVCWGLNHKHNCTFVVHLIWLWKNTIMKPTTIKHCNTISVRLNINPNTLPANKHTCLYTELHQPMKGKLLLKCQHLMTLITLLTIVELHAIKLHFSMLHRFIYNKLHIYQSMLLLTPRLSYSCSYFADSGNYYNLTDINTK